MNPIIKNIPNTITALNVGSGVVSILFSLEGNANICGLSGIEWGWIFIGIAAVMDFLDGFAARLLHAYSDMGKELDSLCDNVSFGVAPALSLYMTLLEEGLPVYLRCWAVLIPIFTSLRLAKFNIDTRQTTSFIGLPVPANAIFWIGYTAMIQQGVTLLEQSYILIPTVLVLSYLMVSELPLFSLKFKSFGWKGNGWRWLLIITTPILFIIFGVSGLMWLIGAYVLYSICDWLTSRKG